MKVVTAIDRPYLPGLIALHNSLKANSPNSELICITYGDVAADVRARGIRVIEAPALNVRLPTTWRHPHESAPMYVRLIVPQLLGETAVWLDADQIVLKPLDELFNTDYGIKTCAAVPSTPMARHIGGLPEFAPNDRKWEQIPGLYAGLLVFNHRQWVEQQVTERCFRAMNEETGLDFFFVVQSVLGYVLCGEFYPLDFEWQRFGTRSPTEITAETKVVHWHGHGRNPWTHEVNNRSLWQQYAECT